MADQAGIRRRFDRGLSCSLDLESAHVWKWMANHKAAPERAGRAAACVRIQTRLPAPKQSLAGSEDQAMLCPPGRCRQCMVLKIKFIKLNSVNNNVL